MNQYVLHIIERADGTPNPLDNTFVIDYDPSFCPEGTEYDGGRLEVADDKAKAKVFDDPKAAFEYWRQSHGTRIDGKPNRPLTAFTVSVEPL